MEVQPGKTAVMQSESYAEYVNHVVSYSKLSLFGAEPNEEPKDKQRCYPAPVWYSDDEKWQLLQEKSNHDVRRISLWER